MKKLGFVVMPLMAISLLANCGGQTPTPEAKEYFVTFESNGGSHIETKRVKDGESVAEPEDPTFAGHAFKGWYVTNPNPYPTGDEYDFSDKITSDITLYAYWQETGVTYHNFVFTGTNCTILNNAELTIPIKEGTTSVQFTILPNSGYNLPRNGRDITITGANATYSNGVITISEMTEEVTVTATSHHEDYIIHYTGTNCKGARMGTSPAYNLQLRWNGEGENMVMALNPDAGYSLPDKISVTFDGSEGTSDVDYQYNKSSKQLTLIKRANISISVTATKPIEYIVSFDANGGEVTSTNPVSVNDGGTILNAPTLADRPGYDKTAVTWYQEPALTNKFDFGESGTPVTSNMVLYAKWGDISQFTVNFYNDDGTKYESLQNIKVNYGDKVTYEDCPTESPYDNHYTFDGWYNKKPSEAGAELFPFDTPLTGDPKDSISIYAKHSKKTYHVTFDANGGEITSGGTPLDVTYKDSIPEDKRPTVFRSGYESTTTWCTDKSGLNVFTFGATKITDNTTLYAKWGTPTPPTIYTVTLDANGGSYSTGPTFSFDAEEGDNLSEIIKIVSQPYLSNKTFAYYTYSDGTAIDYDDIVTSNVELKAHYFDITAPISDLDSPKNISWDEIKVVAVTNGSPHFCFKLGATKNVEVNGKNHTIRIIGFNHDKVKTPIGTPPSAGITFEFADVITKNDGSADTTCWNIKDSNQPTNYKYSDSTISDFLNVIDNSIFTRLPDDLKAEGMIEEVYKPVAETENYEINRSFTTKLFPLSYREMTAGSISSWAREEGTTYAFYTGSGDSNTNRIKNVADGSAGVQVYWLRSPTAYRSYWAWRITEAGTFRDENFYIYDRALAVAPAFCI